MKYPVDSELDFKYNKLSDDLELQIKSIVKYEMGFSNRIKNKLREYEKELDNNYRSSL